MIDTKNCNEVKETEEVFSYLDDLKESGVTNMFGARPYVEEEFGFSKVKSGHLLSKWMRTFEDGLSVSERVEKLSE